jgi:hypothetical protein
MRWFGHWGSRWDDWWNGGFLGGLDFLQRYINSYRLILTHKHFLFTQRSVHIAIGIGDHEFGRIILIARP